MCADLYSHYLYTLGNKSYHPLGTKEISDHRLFGMFLLNISPHNKEVIVSSMTRADGVVRLLQWPLVWGQPTHYHSL